MTPDTITADTASNVPGAASPAPEKHTPSRRQRQAVSKELPKSATACFSCDTPILIESVGFAYWELIHKVERGHNVVQTLPSNNIHDLTGATTTPVKNNCSFEQSSTGGIDMIRMGSGGLTPHHHIFTEKGWMTARQAANIGQGEILTNYTHPRIYNLCLEGGGNILTNTSRTPGLISFTTAATMGLNRQPIPSNRVPLRTPMRSETDWSRDRICSLDTEHSVPVMYRPFPMEILSLKTPQATFLQENGMALAHALTTSHTLTE